MPREPDGMHHVQGTAARALRALLIAAPVAALLAACGSRGSGGVSATRSESSVDEPATELPSASIATTTVPTANPGTPTLPTGSVAPVTAPTPTASPQTSPPDTASPATPTISETPAPAPELARFVPQTFVDPQSNGVNAISVLVPEGWEANAGVQWLPYWSRLAFLQTHVDDPATGVAVDWLPIQDFISFPAPAGLTINPGDNYQGKAYVAPITDPAEFVSQFWMPNDLAELQGATLVSTVEVPEIAQEFIAGFGAAADAHAYRMRYEYTRDGQPWERDVTFALLVSGDANLTSWYVNFAWTVAGPRGSIDATASLVSTIVASRITTPEWEGNYRLVQQLFYQGIQQQMADTVAFGELLAQYRAESQALQAEVTAERAASQDHQAEVFRETLVGVQTYSDPINDTLVQLPIDYNQYWVNEQGEYLAVSEPGFDPNTLNDGTWQPLVPQR